MKSLLRRRAEAPFREPAPEPAPESAPAPEPAAGVDWAWAAAVSLVTAGWVAATMAGWDLRFDTTGRGTAAAAAAAALIGAAWRPRTGPNVVLALAGLVVLPLGLAQAAGGASALLGATLVAAAGVEVISALRERVDRRPKRLIAAAFVIAAACLIAGIALGGGEGISRPLPSGDVGAALLGVFAGVVLVLVATFGDRRTRPLIVAGLLVALGAVSGLSASAVAGIASVAATVWALCAPRRPGPALAALAIAAATLPAVAQASGLLAGAAALGLVLPHPVAAVLGIPGAAAVAAGLVAHKVEWQLVMVVLSTAVTALALGRGFSVKPRLPRGRMSFQLLPACALASWLAVSPGSWGWTGAAGFGTYDRGAPLALAAALLAVVGGRVWVLSTRAMA